MKIATVNVWYWTISNAPYSASRPSVTSRQPPSTAGRIWRSVTRDERAPRSEAEAARGLLEAPSRLRERARDRQVDERVERQRHDQHRREVAVQAGLAARPSRSRRRSRGCRAAARAATAHRRRRRERRALDAPRRADAEHRAQRPCRRRPGARVFHSSTATVWRNSSRSTSPQPDCCASTTRNTSGSSTSAAAIGGARGADQRPAPPARRAPGSSARRAARWWATVLMRAYSSPSFCSSSSAELPSPSCGRGERRGLAASRAAQAPARLRRPAAAGTRSCGCGRSPPGLRG